MPDPTIDTVKASAQVKCAISIPLADNFGLISTCQNCGQTAFWRVEIGQWTHAEEAS